MLRILRATRVPNLKALRLCLLVVFATLFGGSVHAQTSSATQGHTPSGLSPGSPAGSYALSGFDTINPYNGGLNFSLPLLNLGGRGGATYTMPLRVEQKWTALHDVIVDPETNQQWDFLWPEYNWWTGFKPGYSPGIMQGRQAGYLSQTCMTGGAWSTYFYTLTRLSFIAPDGTEFELRDQLTGGQVSTVPICTPVGANGASRGTTFVTADGTAATFVSDTPIYDSVTIGGQGIIYPSGFLTLRDGTRYRIDEGQVTWMRDRNGNKLAFVYNGSAVTSITDSVNRQITIEYDIQDVAPYGLCDRITFKGFGGASRIIRIAKTALGNALRSGYSLQSALSLFPELFSGSSGHHNPTVISAVYLPDNGVIRKYEFRYNSYGELARVKLPTGGAFEYDWAAGATGGATSGVICELSNDMHIYRRIIERRVYPDGASGSAFASRMTYSRPEHRTANCSYSNQGFVEVSQFNNGAVLQTRSRHYFFGSPTASLIDSHNPTTYPAWDEGREYKTEIFDANGTTILRRTQHTWQGNGTMGGLTVNPRIVQTTTAIEPAGVNQVAKQTFTHDQYNNETDLYEYNFGTGGPGPLVRRTHTDYLTTNPVNGFNYATTNSIHVRNLPTRTSRYDSAGVEKARTTFEYDNYAIDSNHAALLNRQSISGFDSSFTTSYLTRGNATATTTHLLVNGLVTGSISSYAQFDIAGNVIKVIDARGYSTTIQYDDHFGPPNGNAHLNSAPFELSSAGQVSFAFATRVTNFLGHISYAKFDYHTGRVVDGEDANGVVSSGYSDNEPLDRPTKIIRAVNTPVQNQTVFGYDDAGRIITTSSDLNSSGDGVLVSKVLYDGLGRPIETRQHEGGANYIATQTQYDALGRPFKSSNPFRPWQSETAVWTTQAFDALGRVISVTTPDNAVVTTSYNGNSVTVTDQAGKARKSVTDALGRLIDVYEDPAALNYQTTYLYDVQDNLVKVTQGSQQRFFMYDSLQRLIRARNPEQSTYAGLNLSDPLTGNSTWSVGYQYDANGNLTQKTDARGVVSTYVYDALNRNTTIDYSDTASINPDVKWFYDGATNGKGRFWHFYKGGDASTGSNVDHTAVDSYDALGRPLVQRQLFKLNGTWGPTYQTSRTYNRAGGVTSQVYPSGRTVTTGYDAVGRMSSVTGTLGDGVSRSYASSFVYNPRNQITQELFGTQTPLYHKLQYNVRGQLWDVRVSTGSDINGSWNRGCLQYFYDGTLGYGTSGPDNNGNVRFANTYIPFDEQSNSWAIHRQSYSYDSLNRLASVSEYFVTNSQAESQQSLQSYTYDRWGNRTINAAQTWGTGINNKVFSVNTATNRLGVPSGQPGLMNYDNAGNLITDTYSGAGARTYDADNRMTTAADNTGQISRYTYDADGSRVRVQVASSQEKWHVYGFDNELLAEYRANAAASAPEKEYGYRNGQMLVTATGRFNVALAANGAIATASSTATGSGFATTGAINGNNRGPWGNGEGWNDNTPGAVPDWIQVDFAGSKTIDEISVFSLHDNYTQENTPTETQTFTLYGLLAFNVQYWNGSTWTTIPGGSITGNNKVWRKFTFSPITTSKIRVTITAVPDSWSRVVEIQAFGTSAGGEKVQWLVPDHLGTPRIVLDQTGSLANVKRHDYLPFGEELFAGTGGRTVAQGYSGDGVRQQFTQKERDNETGLDYLLARYYSSTQGRFTSVDPENAGADESDPQSWNGYAYARNNPTLYSDPDGRTFKICYQGGDCQEVTDEQFNQIKADATKLGSVFKNGTIYNEVDGQFVARPPTSALRLMICLIKLTPLSLGVTTELD